MEPVVDLFINIVGIRWKTNEHHMEVSEHRATPSSSIEKTDDLG